MSKGFRIYQNRYFIFFFLYFFRKSTKTSRLVLLRAFTIRSHLSGDFTPSLIRLGGRGIPLICSLIVHALICEWRLMLKIKFLKIDCKLEIENFSSILNHKS